MSNKMLIDSSHPEETRVVVVKGNRLEDFDFESQHKRQIRGNIYLAKVTRVEPSLQAAFVDYGGNRHGFLAFSEIHPDYYQIPLADRQALLEEEEALANAENADDDAEAEANSQKNNTRGRRRGRKDDRNARGRNRRGRGKKNIPDAEPVNFGIFLATSEPTEIDPEEDNDGIATAAATVDNMDVISENIGIDDDDDDADDDDNGYTPDVISEDEDAIEETRPRRRSSRRQYKIQEVIKRRQVILVQIVKEERGNKGAALTTYMSLAGRYSVLMPNTARGGGISRKITNTSDRKRLKDMVKELEVPKGMGVILRTAGANRTRIEVKRDYEYLMRLWDNVRDLTLASSAPALVYEEGSLIKRSIRDLFNKEINEITVAGESGFREAKDFMRMLMPSSAKLVKPWQDTSPIFARTGMEAQLDKLMTPQVTLKSGGYLIINQTEALVAIDVNSGKSTREHSVEETAIATNLEAAEEVARQLRLRDLAGLIVIDFIDMEENRNNRAVEKKLKECLKNDRARIQVGRISHFGLLEMSRQRMRASVLESTMQICGHCQGTGLVRSAQSVALHVIRSIEDYLIRNNRHHITVKTPSATALYLLNDKRETLTDMEQRFGLNIKIEIDDNVGVDMLAIDRGEISNRPKRSPKHVTIDYDESDDDAYVEAIEDDGTIAQEDHNTLEVNSEDSQGGRNKRRRRRRGKNRDRDDNNDDESQTTPSSEMSSDGDSDEQNEKRNGKKRRRSRGRRGGRNHRNRQNRIPNAEVIGPMVEIAAAWDAENTKKGVSNTSDFHDESDSNKEQNTRLAGSGDSDNKGRNRHNRGRGRNRRGNPVQNVQNNENEVKNAPDDTSSAKIDVATDEKATTQLAAPPSPVPQSTSQKSPTTATIIETSNTLAENKKTNRVRATQSNINLDAEPVVVSDTNEKPKAKKGGWWARKLLG